MRIHTSYQPIINDVASSSPKKRKRTLSDSANKVERTPAINTNKTTQDKLNFNLQKEIEEANKKARTKDKYGAINSYRQIIGEIEKQLVHSPTDHTLRERHIFCQFSILKCQRILGEIPPDMHKKLVALKEELTMIHEEYMQTPCSQRDRFVPSRYHNTKNAIDGELFSLDRFHSTLFSSTENPNEQEQEEHDLSNYSDEESNILQAQNNLPGPSEKRQRTQPTLWQPTPFFLSYSNENQSNESEGKLESAHFDVDAFLGDALLGLGDQTPNEDEFSLIYKNP